MDQSLSPRAMTFLFLSVTMPCIVRSRFTLHALLLIAIVDPLVLIAAKPVRVVGTGGRIAATSYTLSSTATSLWQCTAHKLGAPIAGIDVAYMNWVHNATAEVATANAVTINDAMWIGALPAQDELFWVHAKPLLAQ